MPVEDITNRDDITFFMSQRNAEAERMPSRTLPVGSHQDAVICCEALTRAVERSDWNFAHQLLWGISEKIIAAEAAAHAAQPVEPPQRPVFPWESIPGSPEADADALEWDRIRRNDLWP